ncbi:hypothetical protein EBR03_04970 [bacterium]|nr:hypothetical protein [bacterium]
MQASSDKVLAKKALSKIVSLLNDEKANFYFLKTIEIFEKIPSLYQKSFLNFFADEYKDNAPHWKEMAQDETQYLPMVRSILFYFSGNKKAAHPSKEDFLAAIAEYYRSSYFEKAEFINPEKLEITNEQQEQAHSRNE